MKHKAQADDLGPTRIEEGGTALTVAQLSQRWQVSEGTIRRWIAQRRLPVVQLGRNCAIRIMLSNVERFERDRL